MNQLCKLSCLVCGLFLMILPIMGCEAPWESGMTLNLKVDAPHDGAVVHSPTITVNGRVSGSQSASAKVSVNGVDVPLKDRKFSTLVALTEGPNVIHVLATAGEAKLNQKLSVTYWPSRN